jgi:hypothetical protein
MTNTQVFNLSTAGIYPLEKYVATPITFTTGTLPQDFTSVFWSYLDGSGIAIPTGGSLLTRDYLNYHKNPLCPVLNYDDGYYNTFIYYENIDYIKFSEKFIVSFVGTITGARFIEEVSTARIYNTTTNGSTITLNASAIRQIYKTPPEFYFFYIQLNDTTFNSYGYMLYPTRIFLNPKKITNDNGKWQLTTSVDILSSNVIHIQSNSIESDALELHRHRLENYPSNLVTTLPETLSPYKLYFSLYSNKTIIDRNLFDMFDEASFDNSIVPATTSFPLSTFIEYAYINPDTTFLSYDVNYKLDGETINIRQDTKNDSYLYFEQTINPSFLINYNPFLEQQQNFKLLQKQSNSSYNLSDTRNTLLSASINLIDGNISYYNGGQLADELSSNNKTIRLNAILDGYDLETITTSASSTLTNGELVISGINFLYNENILNGMNITNLSSSDIIWETNYPPYCYNYKIKLGDESINPVQYIDSNSLMFYIKLEALEQNTEYTRISAFATSDFNILKIPLSEDDSIKFIIKSTSLENDNDFIDKLSCRYENVPYDIKNSPFVAVKNNAFLDINYSQSDFNGIKFSVAATVTTRSGTMDSFDTLDISLTPPETGTGNKIILNIIDEKSNEITVDASLNITEEDWPARDLRDSKIKWNYGNVTNVSLNHVDVYNSFLSKVTGEEFFDSSTWRVKLSGYGPNLATISLSSQKYNEVVTLSSNPLLYDVLSQGELKVGPLKPLNNLDLTRVIELTAAVPYKDRTYEIPQNIPINWTWEYDDISDPTIQPITAEQTLNDNLNYYYGVDMKSTYLSAIKIKVTPPYSKTFPKIHTVKVRATINSFQPPIFGEYSFRVDDFPDKNLFNCDFDTYYTDYQSSPDYIVGSTRNDTNVITRSEKSVLNFTFSAKNDILNLLGGTGNLIWGIDGVKIPVINQNTFNIQLTDPLSGLSARNIDNLQVSAMNINLTLDAGYAPGWTSAHNVSATTYIYILSSIDFYQPLKFLLFPEYAWIGRQIGEDPGIYDYNNITFLSTDPAFPNYFTNAFAPTAYFHKKSNSQTFWLSANKSYFSEYIYQNRQNFQIVSTTSAYDVLDIPYDPFNYLTFIGLPISLVAYNNSFYPETSKITYIDELTDADFVPLNLRIVDDNQKYLVSQTHRITAATLPFSYGEDTYLNFFKNPKFRIYNDILFRFTPYWNNEQTTSFNLKTSSGLISVMHQAITEPFNTPAKVMGGTVTYYLSTQYWTVSTVAPAPMNSLSAYENLFVIKYGDPSIPLFAGELGYTEFYLYAKPSLLQQIPATTFDNYNIDYPRYPKDPELWKEVLA